MIIMKNKDVLISLIAYVIALLSLVLTGRIKTIPYFLFVLIGIIFAVVGNRKKEISWAANLLIVIGILGALYPLVAWTGDY